MYALKHFSQWSTTYIEKDVAYDELLATRPIEASSVYFNSMVLVSLKRYYGFTVSSLESGVHHKLMPNTSITITARSVMRNFYVGF